jgi:peptidoglycan/xylan/chitin deacetylase (PgdA/CDA1 family)
MLALTFDDGPDPRGTPAVLDALAHAGVRATFFVLGERVRSHPDLVERVLAEGHDVQAHGYGHPRHPDVNEQDVAADIDAALAELARHAVAPVLWRAPFGHLAPFSRALAEQRGLRLAGWTHDTHDWMGLEAGEMHAAVVPALHDGAIVLLHDGVGEGALRGHCDETARVIGPLVTAARETGLEPGPLDPRAPILPAGNPDLARA